MCRAKCKVFLKSNSPYFIYKLIYKLIMEGIYYSFKNKRENPIDILDHIKPKA